MTTLMIVKSHKAMHLLLTHSEKNIKLEGEPRFGTFLALFVGKCLQLFFQIKNEVM